jgi:hypothetical protein
MRKKILFLTIALFSFCAVQVAQGKIDLKKGFKKATKSVKKTTQKATKTVKKAAKETTKAVKAGVKETKKVAKTVKEGVEKALTAAMIPKITNKTNDTIYVLVPGSRLMNSFATNAKMIDRGQTKVIPQIGRTTVRWTWSKTPINDTKKRKAFLKTADWYETKMYRDPFNVNIEDNKTGKYYVSYGLLGVKKAKNQYASFYKYVSKDVLSKNPEAGKLFTKIIQPLEKNKPSQKAPAIYKKVEKIINILLGKKDDFPGLDNLVKKIIKNPKLIDTINSSIDNLAKRKGD